MCIFSEINFLIGIAAGIAIGIGFEHVLQPVNSILHMVGL